MADTIVVKDFFVLLYTFKLIIIMFMMLGGYLYVVD